MRLFVALDIDAGIRERIAAFRDELRPYAPNARWVGSETFHITLQFLGETEKLQEIKSALQTVQGAPVQLAFRNAGFFPSPKAPRVFWVGIEGDANLQPLVSCVGRALAPLGFESESRPFQPHLTLARTGSGRPQRIPGERVAPVWRALQDKLQTLAALEFGTMTAREFYLYESKLSPAGARYTKLARYPLEQPQQATP